MRAAVLLLLLFNAPFLLAQAKPAPDNELRIIASIQPLALIARDLVGDMGEIEVLIPSGASPHDYAMKVSDRRKLDQADLVLWMGPALERFMERTLRSLEPQRVLALGRGLPASTRNHDHNHDHDLDLHQWLDPRLAADMASTIAARLQELVPDKRTLVEERLQALLKRYEDLHRELQQGFAPVQSVGFVVHHRGYDYLVEAYELDQIAWITQNPEQPASVRHLYELERDLRERPPSQKARCLFSEPSHGSTGAANLARQLGLRSQTLDILGDRASSYAEMMRNLASDMVACLSS